MTKKASLGIIFATSAAILWGFTGLLSQYLFKETDVSIGWLMGVKTLISAFIVLLAAYHTEGNKLFEVWRRPSDYLQVAAYGLVGLAGVQLTYSLTVYDSNAAIATILQTLGVVGVIIYSALVFHQRPRRQEYLAVIIALIGTYLLVTRGHGLNIALSPATLRDGSLLVLCGTGLAVLPVGLLKKYSSLTILGWGLLIGGIIFEIGHPFWVGLPTFSLINTSCIILITLIGTTLSYLLFLHSMNYINSTVAALLDTFEPLTAAVGTMLFFNASYNWAEYLGSFLILSTVFILAVGKKN